MTDLSREEAIQLALDCKATMHRSTKPSTDVLADLLQRTVNVKCAEALGGLTEKDVAVAYQAAPNWKSVRDSLVYGIVREQRELAEARDKAKE